MNTNHSISASSIIGKCKMIALGVVLTIGVFLVVFLKGKRPEETPAAKAQPSVQETAPLVEFDAAAHFREMHNRVLSPEAREDNRRKLWEKNFPWKPTYDPAVKATAGMLSTDDDFDAIVNHYDLKAFFESEARLSPQFEQLYRIMEKYDRTDNPVALARLFENLREYHYLASHPPDEIIIGAGDEPWRKNATGEPWTYGELASDIKECFYAFIDGNVHWPHKEKMPDELVKFIIEEVVQIPGMADLEGKWVASSKAHVPDYWDLEVGDSLLVPFVGYQASYDEWNDERNRNVAIRLAKLRAQSRPAGILADGALVNANGQAIVVDKVTFENIVDSDPDGLDLRHGADGRIMLSSAAMASLNERLRNKTPPQNANPPAQTEEEWKMQEALRMLEEAARQQE